MLPKGIEQIVSMLCSSINEQTPIIDSVYLYGSVALGDYIEGSSDIDFIAILRNPPSETDIKVIASSHRKLEAEIMNTDIMGAYLLEKDLGKPHSQINPLITYYDRQLNENGKNADINPITW